MNIIKLAQDIDTSKIEYLVCPFCKELDFDMEGLKSHLEHGDCEIYNSLNISKMNRLMDNF